MAFKCKGDWDSWVGTTFPPSGDPNDGLLVIGQEEVNGKFKGKHKKDVEYNLDGECMDNPHKIHFTTTQGYTYRGDISEKEFKKKKKDVIVGTRSHTKDRKKVDEEWVAVKVT
jgi:hypothetical protein